MGVISCKKVALTRISNWLTELNCHALKYNPIINNSDEGICEKFEISTPAKKEVVVKPGFATTS